jgi:hypothetical protein
MVPEPIPAGVSVQLVAGKMNVQLSPGALLPSLIATVPVGAMPFGALTLTLTVTGCVISEGLGVIEVIAVVELPLATLTVTSLVAVFGELLESTACAVKVNVPAAVGVPVTAPVAVLSVNPPGRVPSVIDHV